MSRALPERLPIAGRDYAVIVLPRVRWRGVELDYRVDHRPRHVLISGRVSPALRPAVLAQARGETQALLLAGGPVPAVA